MDNLVPIPQPKMYGPLGNLPLIDKDNPTMAFCKLAEELGPIYRFEALGYSMVLLSGHELVGEVLNHPKFDKSIAGALYNLRALGKDGLFTGKTTEPNWKKAHNILVPAFSQSAMKGYHEMMTDIALQLVQKWARLNPNESINVPDDMTKLTLDTIGLCGFSYRFNSFYRENHNPFIISMVRALDEAMHQSTRLPILTKLMYKQKRQFKEDTHIMFSLVDQLIAERKQNGDGGETDLLARMLNVKDPETGETLDDENIRHQMITFLIAGHETTSGLLSFALYFLMKNPEVLMRAYEEVDRVVKGPVPTYQETVSLKYIRMVLHEALRMFPTAPQFAVFAKEDAVIGGKYFIHKYETVALLLPQLHRDKDAWGGDVDVFKPERFLDSKKIPVNAYKPFGNGQRACIGMQFALHEAALVLGMILQNFELVDYRNYELKVKQTLTLKPDNFTIRVKMRDEKKVPPHGGQSTKLDSQITANVPAGTILGVNNRPLLVLYGSNMGTAEQVANDLAAKARLNGIQSKASPLNDYAGKLPTEGAVLIVTSSYNGKPPRNARKFVEWLEQAELGSLSGVHYAVFGCGDRNWASTYQAVPQWIDEQLALKGASRFSERGEADAGEDFDAQVNEWRLRLWKDAMNAFELTKIEVQETESENLQIQFVRDDKFPNTNAQYENVQNSRLPERNQNGRKVLIDLPEEISYQEGNQLGIIPTNSPEAVERVLRRFRLNGEEQVILTGGGKSTAHLPLNLPVRIYDLIKQFIELEGTATHEQIRELAELTVCPPHKRELEELLAAGTYEKQVINQQLSMLDLLEKYQACELTFEQFLELSLPLKPKYFVELKLHSEQIESF